MARSHNPFAPKERSKLETPWGVFEVASPNKSRLLAISDLQKRAEALDEGEELAQVAALAVEATASGLANGDAFREAALAAWDADQVELEALRGAAQFVADELAGGVAEGNE